MLYLLRNIWFITCWQKFHNQQKEKTVVEKWQLANPENNIEKLKQKFGNEVKLVKEDGKMFVSALTDFVADALKRWLKRNAPGTEQVGWINP